MHNCRSQETTATVNTEPVLENKKKVKSTDSDTSRKINWHNVRCVSARQEHSKPHSHKRATPRTS